MPGLVSALDRLKSYADELQPRDKRTAELLRKLYAMLDVCERRHVEHDWVSPRGKTCTCHSCLTFISVENTLKELIP